MGEFLNIASLELLKSDLELISKIIKESFNETNSIFQSEIVNMRDIRSSIAKLKSELEDELIENSIIRVEQILDDSDKVIANLQKFVLVLQSLDRLEQMLNGSCKIVKNSLDNSTNRDEIKIIEHKKNLSKFYTIREQREFANGVYNKDFEKKITLF